MGTYNYIDVDGNLIGDGRKCLFIVSEARGGSTYLAETLAYDLNETLGFQLWDLAKEYFRGLDEDTTADDVLQIWGALFLDRSCFVSAKMLCFSASHLCRLARVSPAVREAFFGPNAYWIVLRRENRIDQAVSLALARKTSVFHFYGDPDASPDRDVKLRPREVLNALSSVMMSDVMLEIFAQSLAPENALSLTYEQFRADELGWINRIRSMCGWAERDPQTFVNRAKVQRTGREAKEKAKQRFLDYLLTNYF